MNDTKQPNYVQLWKSKDRWDNELNGTLQSKIKRNMECSNKNNKDSSIRVSKKLSASKTAENADQKTNSNSPSLLARYSSTGIAGFLIVCAYLAA